jgi:predicted enzyme related to lactoylglutathione lyase
MSERTSYPDGAPCWVDLTTPDLESAQRFYGAVMGWQFQDLGPDFQHYTMCLAEQRPVAALMPPPASAENMPPLWNVYFATSDVAATLRKVEAAGGKTVMGPHPIPDAGTLGFAFDPVGASFGLWQAGRHSGSELYDEPGAMCWHQLNTTDGRAADAFYRSVFDFDQQQIGDGATFDYTVWRPPGTPETAEGGGQVAGRWQAPSEALRDRPPYWMTVFHVPDCDAATQTVANAGGKVLRKPEDSPYGRLSTVLDPSGAEFSLLSREHA